MDIVRFDRWRKRIHWFVAIGWVLFSIFSVLHIGASILGNQPFMPTFALVAVIWTGLQAAILYWVTSRELDIPARLGNPKSAAAKK